MTPQEIIKSKLADGVCFRDIVDAIGERNMSLIHSVAKVEGWDFVAANPKDAFSPKVARRVTPAAPVAVAIAKPVPEEPEEETRKKPKTARAKALELLKSFLPGDQVRAIISVMDYDSDIPYLLPFPDAPDDYDLDPAGTLYARPKQGRAGGKMNPDRYGYKGRWICRYKARDGKKRRMLSPKYLMIARTLAERDWKKETEVGATE